MRALVTSEKSTWQLTAAFNKEPHVPAMLLQVIHFNPPKKFKAVNAVKSVLASPGWYP